jgi:hypothetical protein
VSLPNYGTVLSLTKEALFIPLVVTEEEAWQLILYVRSFGNSK